VLLQLRSHLTPPRGIESEAAALLSSTQVSHVAQISKRLAELFLSGTLFGDATPTASGKLNELALSRRWQQLSSTFKQCQCDMAMPGGTKGKQGLSF